MDPWHETWTWPKMREDMASQKESFWDLTPHVRRVICRELLEPGPAPENLVLTMATDGGETCDRFEKAMISLGERMLRQPTLRLKAVCGHVALETIEIVRLGNADFRLSHFPTTFVFSIIPPRMEPDPETGMLMPMRDALDDAAGTGVRMRSDGFPDPIELLELADGVESGLVETQIPNLCALEFHSCILGLPLGVTNTWWAHVSEGRSAWDIEVQDLTIKVSVIGEVVRTLSVANAFRQDFTVRL